MINEKIINRVKLIEENYFSCGGSCMTEIKITYAELVELFGEPTHEQPDNKVEAEWMLKFDGECFSIYDFKQGIRYWGEKEGIPLECITNWHIGGSDKQKALEFANLINENKSGKTIPDYPRNDQIEELIKKIRELDYQDYVKIRNLVNSWG